MNPVHKENPIPDSGKFPNPTTSIVVEHEEEYIRKSVSFRRRLRRLFRHVVARQLTLFWLIAVNVAGWIGRRRRQIFAGEGCEIMLTGRFDSKNWILAHLGPLSASKECSRVWMVSTNPVPMLPKVEAIYPPKWLMKFVGVTQARLLTFLWAAMRKRPHIVGGFHIMVNGIAAVIVGRLAGARSMYFCVGGPAEVCDGGINLEYSIFKHMETVDAVVEKRLLKIVSKFDTIITMGTRAVTFFRDKDVDTNFYVVSGGIDSKRFQPTQEKPLYDFILTGRLVSIKRIDIFLQAIKKIVAKIPDVSAVIVGDGKLKDELQLLATKIGVDTNVSFIGHQDNIEDWLRKSKIFVLTSDSEGLSLSLMEAMMCGLPAVVSDVGDLADLVHNSINGYLVPRRRPDLFAEHLVELLKDVHKLEAFSKVARLSALRYEMQNAVKQWDGILASYSKV